MKTTKWMGLLAAIVLPLVFGNAQPPAPQVSTEPIQTPPGGPASTDVSPAVAEVMRLAEAGVGEDVIVAYIQNSQTGFNLSADQVLYLKDLGLSSQMISAMLNRDTALRNQPQPSQPTAPVTPPSPPQAPVEAPLTPQAPTYVSSPPPAEVNYFYNDLSPYGSWVVLDGYGWCWQPRVVAINRTWRPYCDGGRWIYSDCGWYWYSDYSWGWAPFHYGRWVSHPRSGWVWTPDTVWGPAWVTWRVAGDNCGWAPLPPRAYFDVRSGWRYNGASVSVGFDFGLHANSFTFVAVHDFTHHDLGHRQLPQSQVTKIYNNTTIINNTTVNNNTVVNRGVAVERVAAATHSEIRKARVQDLPVSTGSGRSVATRTYERNSSVVYRPQFKTAPKPATTAVAQKVDNQHPVIQHPTLTTWKSDRTSPARGGGSVSAPQTAPRTPFGTANKPSPTVTAPSASPRSAPQTETSRITRPTTGEKPPSPAPTYSAPKSQQAAQPTPVAPSTSAEPPSSPKPVQAPKTPQRSSGIYNPDAGSRSSPWFSSAQSQSKPAPNSAQGQNPHVYYPKSYYEANEGRSWGHSSQRPSSSQSSSQPSGSSGSSSPQKKD